MPRSGGDEQECRRVGQFVERVGRFAGAEREWHHEAARPAREADDAQVGTAEAERRADHQAVLIGEHAVEHELVRGCRPASRGELPGAAAAARVVADKKCEDALAVQAQHRVALRDRRGVGDTGHSNDSGDGVGREHRGLGEEVSGSNLSDQHGRLPVEVDRHLLADATPESAEQEHERDRCGDRGEGDCKLGRLGKELAARDRHPAVPHHDLPVGAASGRRRGTKRGVRAA